MTIRAVIFDIGGVVTGSPLHAIADYEREHGLPAGIVNRVVVGAGPGGAWARLERGELAVGEAFFAAFERDLAAAGATISAADLMQRIASVTAVRPVMLDAIGRIRARAIAVAALTNNWVVDGARDGLTSDLRAHFDVFVESAIEGLRKPDPRIFELVCARLGVGPEAAVFLDDIGLNVKTARALGMTTIKVESPEQALAELEGVLGFALR